MPLLIISLLIVLDQLSKYLVRQWGGFYICNPNIAFGIEVNTVVFYISWILIILMLAILGNPKSQFLNPKKYQNSNDINSKQKRFGIFGFRNLSRVLGIRICPPRVDERSSRVEGGDLDISILLIIAGAISNIIDRLYFGCIIDFIDIPFWPTIFNPADVFIVIGAIILLFKIRTTD